MTVHRIMRLPDVKAATGKSRTSIYKDVALGTFPQQVPIGERAVGWLQADIEQWLHERLQLRRMPPTSKPKTLAA